MCIRVGAPTELQVRGGHAGGLSLVSTLPVVWLAQTIFLRCRCVVGRRFALRLPSAAAAAAAAAVCVYVLGS